MLFKGSSLTRSLQSTPFQNPGGGGQSLTDTRTDEGGQQFSCLILSACSNQLQSQHRPGLPAAATRPPQTAPDHSSFLGGESWRPLRFNCSILSLSTLITTSKNLSSPSVGTPMDELHLQALSGGALPLPRPPGTSIFDP